MSNGSITLLPHTAELGDIIFYSSDPNYGFKGWQPEREPFLFRPKPDLGSELIDSEIYSQFCHFRHFRQNEPIIHCTLIGISFEEKPMKYSEMDKVPWVSLKTVATTALRLTSVKIKTAVKEPKFGPVTIFAIH